MARKSTPTYIVEMPLATTENDDRRIAAITDASKRLLNTVLQDGLSIVDAIKADPAWAAARKMRRGAFGPNATPEQIEKGKARATAFAAVRASHDFTEFSFQTRSTGHKNAAKFENRVGAHIAQTIGTRVFKALDMYLLGVHGRPRFKGIKRPLHSIEGKNNDATLRWDAESLSLILRGKWKIRIKLSAGMLKKDEWLVCALQGRVKFCRLLWRNVGTKKQRKYYVQLAMEGQAPMKASVLARLAAEDTDGGLDIGPTKLAWVTETDAGAFRFCAQVDNPQKTLEKQQRKLARQSRANNPDNFEPDRLAREGNRVVVKKGKNKKRPAQWEKSAEQKDTEGKIASLHAHAAECRVNAHGSDINFLLSMARTWRHDNVSAKSLQKNYGLSVSCRAPGHYMDELKRKAERACGESEPINVRQLKTSQYDHTTGLYTKKTLSEREHVFGDGRGKVDRDVYSAFLALHAVKTVDISADGTEKDLWSHDPEKLERAWIKLEPALLAKKLFAKNDGVISTSGISRTSTLLGASLCQPINRKASRLQQPASFRDRQIRRAVRAQKSRLSRSEPGTGAALASNIQAPRC